MFEALSTGPSADRTGEAEPPPARQSFSGQLRTEFGRLARPPREDLSILVFNGLLVCGCWFLLPAAAKDWLFELHGPLAFAVVLQSWMLADTPTTNMLGNDEHATLAALPDPPAVRRLLRVKATALSLLVGPVCALTGVALSVGQEHVTAGLAMAALLLALPFGTAAVSSWLGILLPYHRRSLRWRWAHRRPWRQTVRWAVLVIVPYTAVPLVSGALLVPPAVAATAMGGRDQAGHFTTAALVAGAVVACVVAGTVYLFGTRIGAWLAVRRARSLQAYLPDPDRG